MAYGKISEKQQERLEKLKEKKAEEKTEQKKEAERKSEEDGKKFPVKRTTIEASSEEELLEKILGIDWSKIGEEA